MDELKKIRAGSDVSWKMDSMHVFCLFNCTCNFSCSYCYNKNMRKQHKEHLPKDILLQFLEDLATLNKPKYFFYLAGGEPLLYTYLLDFYEYVNAIFPEKVMIHISTNGSLLKRLEPCIKKSPYVQNVIEISMHMEQMDLERYKKVLSNFAYVHNCAIRTLLAPGRLKDILEIQEFVENLGYEIQIRSITQKGELHPDYTQEERDFFEMNTNIKAYPLFLSSTGYEDKAPFFCEYLSHEEKIKRIEFSRDASIFNHDLINYSGMNCTAGFSSLHVMSDGMVKYCHGDKSGLSFSLKEKSILDYPFLSTPVLCHAQKCGCQASIALPKWHPELGQGPAYLEKTFSENIKE